jgi:hypothetical protein
MMYPGLKSGEILPVLVLLLQESVRNFSSVNLGKWRFFTTCTGSPSFHTNSRSSVVQPSATQATSPFQDRGNEELWLLGRTVQVSWPPFWRNRPTLSAEWNNKPNSAGYVLHCRCLVWRILWAWCGRGVFPWNISWPSTDYMVFRPRRLNSFII